MTTATSCPSCKSTIDQRAVFCPSCGGSLVPPLVVCGECGGVAPSHGDRCEICSATLPLVAERLTAPARGDGRFWVMVRAEFQCRHCGHLSPLNHLDADGSVACLRCGFEQAADPQAWKQGLAFCHEVGDLAGSPEGRLPSVEVSIGSENPHKDLGSMRASASFALHETVKHDGIEKSRNLRLEVSPGCPLCQSCHRPLEVEVTERGSLRSKCAGCGDAAMFQTTGEALRLHKPLWGALGDEHRTDRAAARLNAPAAGGAVSIQCPTCGGALEMTVKDHFVSCKFCRTPARIPARLRSQVFREGVDKDRWWLLFEGPSPTRQRLLSKARKRREHEARMAEQQRAAEARRNQQRAAHADDQRDAHDRSAEARRNQQRARERAEAHAADAERLSPATTRSSRIVVLFTAVGLMATTAGAYFAFQPAPKLAPPKEPQAGKTEQGDEVARPKAPEPPPPPPISSYQGICKCAPPAGRGAGRGAGKDAGEGAGENGEVELAVLPAHNGTMSMGSVVRKFFSLSYALRGESDVRLEPGPEDAPSIALEGIRLDLAMACTDELVVVVGSRSATAYARETGKRRWSTLLPERFGPERLVEGDLQVTCHDTKITGDVMSVQPAPDAPVRPLKLSLKDGKVL